MQEEQMDDLFAMLTTTDEDRGAGGAMEEGPESEEPEYEEPEEEAPFPSPK